MEERRENMEKLKEKHNHTLTNILKVLTFAIVLLFPFLVFMPSALYYGCNKYAQIEIPQKVAKYQTNEVNTNSDIIIGNIYHLELSNSDLNLYNDFYINIINGYIKFHAINFMEGNTTDITLEQGITLNIYYDETNQTIQILLYDTTATSIASYTCDTFNINADVVFLIDNEEIRFTYQNHLTGTEYNEYNITETTTISENLSNSWENMWQTPLFKWTQNTPFTATTNAFASVFNISQESGYYNLIAYFITITGIYLVIDIIIGVATMLTHIIGRQD